MQSSEKVQLVVYTPRAIVGFSECHTLEIQSILTMESL